LNRARISKRAGGLLAAAYRKRINNQHHAYAVLRGKRDNQKKRKEENSMADLILQENNLPAKMEDLSRFVLVGREKYNSVRAEIRAIDKLKLAEEVRDQKRQEAQMLSEVLLDAEVRLGELFKQIPTNQGKRTDVDELRSAGGTKSEKSKEETIESLGFSKTQAYSFETLADNADIVEQVKAEARENGEFPTRARVLELAANRNKTIDPSGTRIINMTDYQQKQDNEYDGYEEFLDLRYKVYKDFMKIVDLSEKFEITETKMDAFRDNFDRVLTVEDHVGYANKVIEKINLIKTEIQKSKKRKYNIN